jgi:serine phosphatase RsbU (regulator of sigma subunit)
MSQWRRIFDLRITGATEWWRMPLIGLLVSAPISLTTSLFLASYGAEGPYGGFWRLVIAGLAASVPIFALSGVFFAPLEIWLNRRPRRLRAQHAAIMRAGALAIAGIAGALVGYAIVVWALPAAPPSTLLVVLLITYPLDTAIVGLAYTLYDEYIHQLNVSTQLTQEMRVARTIQQGLFPARSPQLDGYTLATRCQPARETGGDFFDFIELGQGRLGVVIADVAGKGMPAALLMANARSTLRAEARLGFGPSETLRQANRSLCDDVNSGSFVTCLYAMLDATEHRICFANAGHPLPLLYDNGATREIEVYGLPLGLRPDATYEEVHVSLQPGDTMVLYTDGITETMNASRELLGFERLVELLQCKGHRPAESLIEETWSVARAFGGEVGQDDDMTVIVLKLQQ